VSLERRENEREKASQRAARPSANEERGKIPAHGLG